eukprot:6530349-Lingulodinium_polyedra.AAC.1
MATQHVHMTRANMPRAPLAKQTLYVYAEGQRARTSRLDRQGATLVDNGPCDEEHCINTVVQRRNHAIDDTAAERQAEC